MVLFGVLTANMASSPAKTFLVLVLCCIKLLFAQLPKQGSVTVEFTVSAFGQAIVENDTFYVGDALQHFSGEQQDGLRDLQKHLVFCGENAMQIVLPSGSHEVNIIGLSGKRLVLESPNSCGCSMVREQKQNILVASYSGCYVTVENGKYTLRVLYRNAAGQFAVAAMSCSTNLGQTHAPKPHCLLSGWCSLDSSSNQPLNLAPVPVKLLAPTPYVPRPVPSTTVTPVAPRNVAGAPIATVIPKNVTRTTIAPVSSTPSAPVTTRGVPKTTMAPVTTREVPKTSIAPVPTTTLSTVMPRDVPETSKAPVSSMPWSPVSTSKVPKTSVVLVPSTPPAAGCSIPTSQRLACRPGATAAQCLEEGCCMDMTTSTCYYPMNECTADGYFVFTVPANITSDSLNPAGLTVAGKNGCRPVIATKDFAVFKFRMTECGTRSYQIGLTTIYLAEVHSTLRTLNLKYAVITRDHFFRLMVECRYSKFSSDPEGRIWASAGYMVMSPHLPALVKAKGLYGVQLRIAEDKTFTKFLPHNHLPFRKLLGNPVHLEVRINSPKPEATLLVHYCVAYPRSAKSALILLYDGCPNPFDSDISIIHMADEQNRHQRRFEVKAFQFMNQSLSQYLNEEIYFMCSTEVCMPSEKPCKQTCFDE